MLKNLDSFLGFFQQSEIDSILAAGEHKRIVKGAVLIAQGTALDALYVVLAGGFDILVPGREEPVGSFAAGEVVGGIAFLDHRPMYATIRANDDATVLCVPRADLDAMLSERMDFAVRFYRALGMQLSQLYRQELRALTPDKRESMDAPVPSENMADVFRQSCAAFADREAYLVNGKWITYGEACGRVERLAASFASLQPPGDGQPVLATLLPNCEYILEAFYAAAVSGSIMFPVNHRLSAEELAGILKTSGAGILITSP